MSSAIEELIFDWNATYTYKIKESDLLKPSETFVVKALSSLLGSMFIKDCYTLQMQAENKDEAGIAKAKFVKYIDGLYKVSDTKNSFLFIDLINPTSKKTVHLLKVLHNYFCYFQMLKKNILGRVSEKLDSRDQLLKVNKDLKIEIERTKMQKETFEKKVESYERELPALKNETQAIDTHIKKLSLEFDKCKRALESTCLSNREALKKIETLNDELVDEEEVQNLLSDRQKIEKELNEIKEHQSATHARLLESHQKKEEVKLIITGVDKLLKLLNLEPVLKQKEQKEETLKNLKDFQNKLLKIQEDLTSLMTDFNLQVTATNKKIATKKKKIKTQQKKCQIVHKENLKQMTLLVSLKEELEKERALLEKSKNEMEKVLIIGQQTLEYLGYVPIQTSGSA